MGKKTDSRLPGSCPFLLGRRTTRRGPDGYPVRRQSVVDMSVRSGDRSMTIVHDTFVGRRLRRIKRGHGRHSSRYQRLIVDGRARRNWLITIRARAYRSDKARRRRRRHRRRRRPFAAEGRSPPKAVRVTTAGHRVPRTADNDMLVRVRRRRPRRRCTRRSIPFSVSTRWRRRHLETMTVFELRVWKNANEIRSQTIRNDSILIILNIKSC